MQKHWQMPCFLNLIPFFSCSDFLYYDIKHFSKCINSLIDDGQKFFFFYSFYESMILVLG